MKSMQWKTYRTRFLVKAKQLSSNLSFTDPLGRHHSGRRGDYLVETSDGVVSIAPRKIFEDIYVAMSDNLATQSSQGKLPRKQGVLPLELLVPAMIDLPAENSHSQFIDERRTDSPGISRARRKSPQPVRPSSSRLGLM